MAAPSPNPSGPAETGSILWTLMLGSALVALAAASTRRAAPLPPAVPEPLPEGLI